MSIGGRSLWGAVIDPLAQRYGWTMDYIMWGISWANLNILLLDVIDFVDGDLVPESGDDPDAVKEFIKLHSNKQL